MTPEGRIYDRIYVFSHFCRAESEIWHGGADLRAKFHVYQGNVSPLRGEKPIFGLLSKNNTGIAVLRAGLPVIIKKLRSMYCTIEATKLTTDRHEASRGLFATAELLVVLFLVCIISVSLVCLLPCQVMASQAISNDAYVEEFISIKTSCMRVR